MTETLLDRLHEVREGHAQMLRDQQEERVKVTRLSTQMENVMSQREDDVRRMEALERKLDLVASRIDAGEKDDVKREADKAKAFADLQKTVELHGDRIGLLRTIVFGAVGMILVAFLSGVIALVIVKSGGSSNSGTRSSGVERQDGGRGEGSTREERQRKRMERALEEAPAAPEPDLDAGEAQDAEGAHPGRVPGAVDGLARGGFGGDGVGEEAR